MDNKLKLINPNLFPNNNRKQIELINDLIMKGLIKEPQMVVLPMVNNNKL